MLEAALDDSSMNAVMCAVLSGDTFMLRLLVANGADMNTKLRGLSSLGYYDSQTVLMAATKSRQDLLAFKSAWKKRVSSEAPL